MWGKLFQRLNNVFKSNANDAIDKMEDPVKMIKLAISEMELAIQKSTEALAKAMANQKTLEKKLTGYKAEANDWYNKAMMAIRSGDEELGKKALEKKALADKQVEQYTTMNNQSVSMVDQLRTQLDRMKTKFDEAKAKESILIAQANTSKAQAEIADQLGGISMSGLSNFSRFEEKINQMSAEAEAKVELNEATSRIDRQFEALESNTKVYTDFEEIKRKLEEEEEAKRLLEEEKKHKQLEQKFRNDPKKIEEQKSKLIDNSVNNKKDVQKIFNELNPPAPEKKPDNLDDKLNDFFNNKKQ